ncbi:MAG: hypothetical protein QM781_01645 [Chitinophagaceae bacterium]
MKKIIIVLIYLASISFIMPIKSVGQNKINKIVNSISNDNLRFEVAIVGTTRFIDSTIVATPKYRVFIESVNLESLSNQKTRKLIRRLIPLLNDNAKDWHTNILLYQLTKRDASTFITIRNRSEWIEKYKNNDLRYWRSYLD